MYICIYICIYIYIHRYALRSDWIDSREIPRINLFSLRMLSFCNLILQFFDKDKENDIFHDCSMCIYSEYRCIWWKYINYFIQEMLHPTGSNY